MVVMMDMIIMIMEMHMAQITAQHMQRGIHIVIEVIVTVLPLVIHLVIVVIHKRDIVRDIAFT